MKAWNGSHFSMPSITASSSSRGGHPVRERSAFTIDEENDRELFKSDPHSPKEIEKSYFRLKKRIFDLQHELGQFSSECRQLGRSYALILAARDVREGLENILLKFYDNAYHLSPVLQDPSLPIGAQMGIESFPYWFEGVAEAFENMRDRLNEFREYTDESVKVKWLMGNFAEDLKYRASCLMEYKGQLDTLYNRQYIHDLADEMGEDLDNMITAFTFFNIYGMPAMQYEQKRDTDILLSMSTAATFFSAVTATTLQMSLDRERTPVLSIVNSFWFCSLVLSIGAALNSLLAVVWKRTPYGSRGRRLPLWVTIWIHASAPFFLAISIACFSAGLALFSYGSDQAPFTSSLTLVATAVTSFGLAMTIAWFGYEQWIAPFLLPNAPWSPFRKRRDKISELSPEEKITRPVLSDRRRSRTGSISDLSAGSTDTNASSFKVIPPIITSHLSVSPLISKVASFARTVTLNRREISDPEIQFNPPPPVPDTHERRREQWRKSAKLAASVRLASNAFWLGSSRRSSPNLPIPFPAVPDSKTNGSSRPYLSPMGLTFPTEPYRVIPHQHEAIQDMAYSSTGQYLAFTSYDASKEFSTTSSSSTESNYSNIFRHQHGHRRTSKQVKWSPDGGRLLVRLDHGIDILDPACRMISSIKRAHSVEAASWCSSSNMLFVERNTIFKMTVDGHTVAKYRFENLLLRDIAVVPKSTLLLIVGRVLPSRDQIIPSNSRAEKQFILYDMNSRLYLSRNPILDDVRHITLAQTVSSTREGFDILLGHKSTPSPRLWTLTLQPQMQSPHQLTPAGFHLQSSVALTGYGYFAGDQDQIIAGAALDGDIHFWDRETGRPIHRLEARAVSNGLRSFAWCPRTTNAASFASTSEEGIKIWTMPQSDLQPESPIIGEPNRKLPEQLDGSKVPHSSVLGSAITFEEPSNMIDVG